MGGSPAKNVPELSATRVPCPQQGHRLLLLCLFPPPSLICSVREEVLPVTPYPAGLWT